MVRKSVNKFWTKFEFLSISLNILFSKNIDFIELLKPKKIDDGTADADMLNSYIAKQRRDNPDIDVSELAVNGAVFLATGVYSRD